MALLSRINKFDVNIWPCPPKRSLPTVFGERGGDGCRGLKETGKVMGSPWVSVLVFCFENPDIFTLQRAAAFRERLVFIQMSLITRLQVRGNPRVQAGHRNPSKKRGTFWERNLDLQRQVCRWRKLSLCGNLFQSFL